MARNNAPAPRDGWVDLHKLRSRRTSPGLVRLQAKRACTHSTYGSASRRQLQTLGSFWTHPTAFFSRLPTAADAVSLVTAAASQCASFGCVTQRHVMQTGRCGRAERSSMDWGLSQLGYGVCVALNVAGGSRGHGCARTRRGRVGSHSTIHPHAATMPDDDHVGHCRASSGIQSAGAWAVPPGPHGLHGTRNIGQQQPTACMCQLQARPCLSCFAGQVGGQVDPVCVCSPQGGQGGHKFKNPPCILPASSSVDSGWFRHPAVIRHWHAPCTRSLSFVARRMAKRGKRKHQKAARARAKVALSKQQARLLFVSSQPHLAAKHHPAPHSSTPVITRLGGRRQPVSGSSCRQPQVRGCIGRVTRQRG